MTVVTFQSFEPIDSDSFCSLSCDGPKLPVRRQHCPQPPQGVRALPVAFPASWWGLGAHSVTLYWHTIIIVPVMIFCRNVIFTTMTLTDSLKSLCTNNIKQCYVKNNSSIVHQRQQHKTLTVQVVYKTGMWICSKIICLLVFPQVCTATNTKYSTYWEDSGL